MKKLTLEEFQKRVNNNFPDKDFTVLEYNGYSNPVKLKCNTCNHFINYKIAHTFLSSSGCSYCNGRHQYTTEEFIEDAIKIHNNKYDYSEVIYLDNKTDIKIKCNRCKNVFWQRPSLHLTTVGCICYKKEILKEKSTLTTEEFIEKMETRFPNKFKYDKTKYINTKEKVEVFCKRCKEYFWQKPSKLLMGFGHDKCALERSIETRRVNIEEFIKRSRESHSIEYGYGKVKFLNVTDNIEIYCPKCKKYFFQIAKEHMEGSNCPDCIIWKGEEKIKDILEIKNIEYIRRYTFDNLKDIDFLSYDFLLPKYNVLIEYNGNQHYSFNSYFHKTLHDFHKQKHHDWLKRKYAISNNFKLISIPYWDFKNIEKILTKSLS